jgi:tetratricopeptide (TPR) repeat protein
MKQKKTDTQNLVRKKSKFLPRILLSVIVISFFSVSIYIFYHFVLTHRQEFPSEAQLHAAWTAANYRDLYTLSDEFLSVKPNNITARTFRGYSSFYLAVAETDPILAQQYIDEAINNIRIAIQTARKTMIPQLQYMLGKAYFYKDTLSSYHYYADLAVQYLEAATDSGFSSDDIPEYLGLSYAALSMRNESIAAFTEALLVRESDVLLLSIAEQYYLSGQIQTAKSYLFKLNKESSDDKYLLQSSLLLGKIYTEEENYDKALDEFSAIVKKDPDCADAYYGIGVIYEKQGDLVKARAEWRNALKVQVDHQGALKKMGL